MQLNISSDYAIRAMLFLAISQGCVNVTKISTEMNIPINTCKRNLQLLKKAGLVTTLSGTTGGYSLAKKSEDIRLSDILRAVGEKLEFNRCLEEDCFCNRNAIESCPVHQVYIKAQKGLDIAFNTTIKELQQCS